MIASNRESAANRSTGSAIPDGADAVVMIEHTEAFAGSSTVEVLGDGAYSEHRVQKGEDVPAGRHHIKVQAAKAS
ncbi:MAG TPA: hypothetical protein VK436_07110 [Methanocella sp.]|nr:hypothetical protein [Methanocella sp.]